MKDFLIHYVQNLRGSQSALGILPLVVEARGSCKRADPRVCGFWNNNVRLEAGSTVATD